MKRFATEGKNGKEGRVYLTHVSGMSKAGKAFNMIKVYDPNANASGNTHKPTQAPAPAAAPAAAPDAEDDDLPF